MDGVVERSDRLITMATKALAGHKRRLFIAEVTLALCDSNVRRSEQRFGWGRATAEKGLHERASGVRCLENFAARRPRTWEERHPVLAADLWGDGLAAWWRQVRGDLGHVRGLVTCLDNGPNNSGTRTQFLKRLVEFADGSGLEIRRVYYPPYHSKYNPIERCWSSLERKWSGMLLSSVKLVLQGALRLRRKGQSPAVRWLAGDYPDGVRVTGAAKRALESRLERSADLPKHTASSGRGRQTKSRRSPSPSPEIGTLFFPASQVLRCRHVAGVGHAVGCRRLLSNSAASFRRRTAALRSGTSGAGRFSGFR